MMETSVNIASHLCRMAALYPDNHAIICPWKRGGGSMTYRELDGRSSAIAAGLESAGIGRGVRTALMVRPGLDLFSLAFALFKCGAVPVLVDPGIGLKNMKSCLDRARPEAFIGIGRAHLARILLGWARTSITHSIGVGRTGLPGILRLADLETTGRKMQSTVASVDTEEIAAIVFTSGSTGPPKGVVYRHGNFSAQIEALKQTYDFEPGEVNLPTFPLFALFDPALGMTSIIPDMDPTRPAHARPENILGPIRRFSVTTMFGSPALLDTVSRWGVRKGVELPSLKRVISAGAPVSPRIIERFRSMLGEGAEVFTPYGATESLPVASISGHEILSETSDLSAQGRGTCVGRPVASAEVHIISITSETIDTFSPDLVLPVGRPGEIIVSSPQTTREYFEAPEKTLRAKIRDGDRFFHRMGDLGYFDDQGRVWFCGRKAHSIVIGGERLFSVPIEGIFNSIAGVRRSAFTAIERDGKIEPVICIERERGSGRIAKNELLPLLRQTAAQHRQTSAIAHFLFRRRFPVDIRHNAKINRALLGRWAARKLGGRSMVAGS